MKHALLITPIIFLVCLASHAAETPKNRIVTISTLCLPDEENHRTRDYVAGQIEHAAQRMQHDLIVAPLTPFLSFREDNETEDLAPFAELAKSHRTYLCIALRENASDGRLFYTSVLIGRNGEIAGKYRKTHALPDDTMSLGDDLPVFETDFGVIGCSIGTDFYFPEMYTVEYMKGAEILIWQHYPERFREHFQWIPLIKARALDNHAHLVTSMYADPRSYIANRYEMGMQGAAWGRSMIINRAGTPIADTGYEDGIASATIDLDKRKADPYTPWKRDENIFIVNSMGDRTAFSPLTESYDKPVLPEFTKRKARIAVGYFRDSDMWSSDEIPETMLRILDEAAKLNPDIVLLSEMRAREATEINLKTMESVAERARRMNAYILIGGVDNTQPGDKKQRSHAWLWNRKGEVVYKEPLYWTRGFQEIKVRDTDFARIGVHICGDLYTGEIDRVLALKGAEIIFDPSQMWGADGYNNEMLLRARAVDNGCWIACAHWNSSDPGLRSVIIDPYGQVISSSQFQKEGVIFADIDFNRKKVYYTGHKTQQPEPGDSGIRSYFTGHIPEQRTGWRDMIFPRRRPELYGILPTVNEVILKNRTETAP